MSLKNSPTLTESLKESIKNGADVSVEKVTRFLLKEKKYVISIEEDPMKTGRIWLIRLNDGVNDLSIACIYDGSFLAAAKTARMLSLLLQIFGYDIQTQNAEDSHYTEEEKTYSSEIEKLKWTLNVSLGFNVSQTFKSFFFYCIAGTENIPLFDLGGMSTKSAEILCRQLCFLLAVLGKNVVAPDMACLNKFGMVDFIPDSSENMINELIFWRLASNGLSISGTKRNLVDRIDYDASSTSVLSFCTTSKYLAHTSIHDNIVMYDNSEDVRQKPNNIRVLLLEKEAYNSLEAEMIIKDLVKKFIDRFGMMPIRIHVVKKSFTSSGKCGISVAVEDAPY